MLPHRMHLKGPWQYEWLGPSDALPPDVEPAGRLKMPAEWRTSFGSAAGTARFRRRFNRPTNLDADERVFVVLDGVGGTGEARLDDRRLGTVDGAQGSAAFDVTDLLKPANELVVELEFDPAVDESVRGGLWGPVAIEIRRAEG